MPVPCEMPGWYSGGVYGTLGAALLIYVVLGTVAHLRRRKVPPEQRDRKGLLLADMVGKYPVVFFCATALMLTSMLLTTFFDSCGVFRPLLIDTEFESYVKSDGIETKNYEALNAAVTEESARTGTSSSSSRRLFALQEMWGTGEDEQEPEELAATGTEVAGRKLETVAEYAARSQVQQWPKYKIFLIYTCPKLGLEGGDEKCNVMNTEALLEMRSMEKRFSDRYACSAAGGSVTTAWCTEHCNFVNDAATLALNGGLTQVARCQAAGCKCFNNPTSWDQVCYSPRPRGADTSSAYVVSQPVCPSLYGPGAIMFPQTGDKQDQPFNLTLRMQIMAQSKVQAAVCYSVVRVSHGAVQGTGRSVL